MQIDFELLLVLGTLISGLIWAIDSLFFRRARLQANGVEEKARPRPVQDPVLVEYARSFFPVLLIVLVLRSFLGEPFRIPSESMLPTLQVGDFILVNKYAYGVRLPVVHTEVLSVSQPERGEVAVFRYPRNPSMNYIKRIVGLPGDTVVYRDRQLYINGEAVSLAHAGAYDTPPAHRAPDGLLAFSESLGDREYTVLLDPRGRSPEGEFEVPSGHYFALGDNRDYSNDSRQWGFVPEEALIGRATVIWMNWNWNGSGMDWERVGTRIP